MAEPVSALQTRPSLLFRLRDSGDLKAWDLFSTIYSPLIHRFCVKKGLQEADARDVSQEVLLEVTKSIATFEYHPEKGRFRNWLGIIVQRKIFRLFRSQNRSRTEPTTDEQLNQIAETASPEWLTEFSSYLIQVAMERLEGDFESHSWQAFKMMWFEDQPAESVAKKLGMTKTAAYMAKSRILNRLREEVISLAEDLPQLVPLD